MGHIFGKSRNETVLKLSFWNNTVIIYRHLKWDSLEIEVLKWDIFKHVLFFFFLKKYVFGRDALNWAITCRKSFCAMLFTAITILFRNYNALSANPFVLTHYRLAIPFAKKNILEDLFSSVLLQFKEYHPSGNLKFNNLPIFQSLIRILMEKILPISPNQFFSYFFFHS